MTEGKHVVGGGGDGVAGGVEETIYENFALQLLLAVVLVLLTLIPIFFLLRKSKLKRDVLLLGLSDSGKTLIISRLSNEKYVQTQTSIKENVSEFERAAGYSLRLVDIPGHERLRLKFLDEYKSTARGLVFIIDASTVQKDIRDVAEFLYLILTDNVIASGRINILILCNKQDLITAKTSNVVSQLLQKELTTLHSTKSKQLGSLDSSRNTTNVLGKEDAEIELSSLSNPVTFAECTGVFDQDNSRPAQLDQLKDWLNAL